MRAKYAKVSLTDAKRHILAETSYSRIANFSLIDAYERFNMLNLGPGQLIQYS